MTLSMKEKKILYAYGCLSHHNTVTRLKWLTALTVDPEAKRRMLGLARKVETEMNESWYEDFLSPSAHGDGRVTAVSSATCVC